MANGTKFIPYSKEFVQNKVQKVQGSIKDMSKAIGKVEVPIGVKVRTVADTTGNTYKVIGVDKTSVKDLAQKITAKGEGSKAVAVTKYGSHFLEEFKLKPNVQYETNGYLYQTDDLGRIKRVSGELTLEMGERNTKHQLAAGGEDRVKAPSTQGDHGGHLIGTQFNGSPLIDNIVAMNESNNRGTRR
ncbi:DNA/RNA non-specific endonuclease [Peribacillus sp. NPDC097206]|uniref:DNA/RNA non-specific endonuclease n=1 Tax=unclassified Peribacillus TaxID=2675266 RepID=UPI00380AB185